MSGAKMPVTIAPGGQMPDEKRQGFFRELGRRNVYRVAAAYLAFSWLLIQIVETILPVYGFADDAIRNVITALAAFFVPVVVFAWFFELTPGGFVPDREVDHGSDRAISAGRKFDFAIIGLLSIALIYFVSMYDWSGREVVATTGPPDRSVAVLPFVNMSGMAENEYFSDGLTETLLHVLAQIPDIKVPARTSSFFFKGQDIDIREIAEALDVGNVLEGSVQRDGNRVRIVAQLIEADSGYHLWSQTFNREIEDIFAVQDEIANEVANALQVTLIGVGGREIAIAGTDNVDAYDAYLKGVEQFQTVAMRNTENAISFFEEALAYDPDFDEARVRLAEAHLQQIPLGMVPRNEGLARATVLVDSVLARNPEDPYARALKIRMLPNRSDRTDELVDLFRQITDNSPDEIRFYTTAYFELERAGREDEGVEWLERGIAVDPLSSTLHTTHGYHMFNAGDLDKAEISFKRGIELNPDDPTAFGYASLVPWKRRNFVEWFAILREGMNAEAIDFDFPVNLALHLYTFDQPALADQYLARATSISPDSPYVRAAELYALVYKGDIAGALTLSEELVRDRIQDRRGALHFSTMIYLSLMQNDGRLDEALANLERAFPGIQSQDFVPDSRTVSGVQFQVAVHRLLAGADRESVVDLDTIIAGVESRSSSFGALPGLKAAVRYVYGDMQEARRLALDDLDGRQSWLQAWDWPIRYRYVEVYKHLAADPAVAERLSELEQEVARAGREISAYVEEHDLQL
jgi:TolB-like protein